MQWYVKVNELKFRIFAIFEATIQQRYLIKSQKFFCSGKFGPSSMQKNIFQHQRSHHLNRIAPYFEGLFSTPLAYLG